MKKVYIIYDDVMDAADIIAVPDEIYQNIEKLANLFADWLMDSVSPNDQEYWVTLNGKRCLNLNTKGFVNWLNNYYCKKGDKVYIVEQHIDYCPKFKCIEF